MSVTANRLAVVVAAVLSANCGGPSSAAIDAGEEDAQPPCACPDPQSLRAEYFARKVKQANNWFFVSIDPENLFPVGVSCMLAEHDMSVPIFFGSDIVPGMRCDWDRRWDGVWSSIARATAQVLNTHPPDAIPPPDNLCGDCPPVDELWRRAFLHGETIDFPPISPVVYSVSCPDDAVLIGGGCSDVNSWHTPMLGIGPSPDEPDAWRCAWQSDGGDSYRGDTGTVCVRPPREGMALEAVPLRDRVYQVHRTETLATVDTTEISVSCEVGSLLLTGGCQLADIEPPLDQINLLSYGYPYGQEDSQTWKCGWANPLTLVVDATTTAICLRPLEEP